MPEDEAGGAGAEGQLFLATICPSINKKIAVPPTWRRNGYGGAESGGSPAAYHDPFLLIAATTGSRSSIP